MAKLRLCNTSLAWRGKITNVIIFHLHNEAWLPGLRMYSASLTQRGGSFPPFTQPLAYPALSLHPCICTWQRLHLAHTAGVTFSVQTQIYVGTDVDRPVRIAIWHTLPLTDLTTWQMWTEFCPHRIDGDRRDLVWHTSGSTGSRNIN